MIYLAVALGSALGGVARYAISSAMAPAIGGTFPWWTLLINVVGSFVIGYVASYPAMPANVRAVLIPGF
ncbi:MAG: CrcB family protein, partial [Bryobacteraceae bacterium]|nr:CrcB family protein [Bryobacteraceae bacterium]